MQNENQTLTPQPSPNPPSDFDWHVDEAADGVEITRFRNATATVCVIPSQIDGRPVSRVGESAFRDAVSLTSIFIPNGVRSVGADAFFDCSALESLDLP